MGEVCAADGRCVVVKTDRGTTDGRLPITCPLPGMVKTADTFCLDVYEASRPDATAASAGTDGSRATSRKGVLPWQVLNNAEADAACKAAGKRLCTPSEWQTACQGAQKTAYAYGNTYNPKTCNGIDAFEEWQFHLEPTGTFPGCKNTWGAFDLNGNVWEHVQGGSELTIRGGAYNCSDSKALHRCDYIPGNWAPSARGFRCCADGVTTAGDAGAMDRGAVDGPRKEASAADGKAKEAGSSDAVR